MSRRRERALLVALLAVFVTLGTIHSVVVPPFEASDELWHYPMVEYIADHWSLPVQDPANVGPWRQEGSQPPLYYAAAAAATFWIDTSHMTMVRHLNPHVDNGVATLDGNINLVVHNPSLESFPWRGTVLAVHLVRLLSVLMGAGAVYLAYRLVRRLFPARPALALGAAGINAFTPMFVFISGAVNNDNLIIPLCTLALLLMVRIADLRLQIADQGVFRREVMLGVVIGLAALTKQSGLALFPLAAVAVAARTWHQHSEAKLSRRLALIIAHSSLVIVTALLISGWWYWRNWRLYGDPLGWNVFTEILGQRDVPAGWIQLWRERFSFLAGYWGNFGGLNVQMPAWTYAVLEGVVILAAVGLIVGGVRSTLWNDKSRGATTFVIRHLPFLISVLWPAAVLAGWVRWARLTWSSQGRLVFPAISVWSMLMGLGLAGWFPRRLGRWAVAVFALFLLALSAAAPFAWIRPAYALPEPLTDAQISSVPHQLEANFGRTMRLLGYDLETDAAEPGGQVELTLYWEALSPVESDHTVFVHLLGKHDLLVAQRDTFPGLGLLSTTWLEPGFHWADRYVLEIPVTAYTPEVVQVEVGLYDAATERRLPVIGQDGVPLGDNVRFGRVEIRALPGRLPNPLALNFGNRMELVGYDLDRRLARPGEAVTLTLYWRGLRPMDVNYTISAQLIDARQRKAAQHDSWPVDGAAPTAAWKPGEVITDARTLAIYP
ncbi:MAG: glycosyltransferase family 39 protein, partial [Anaerolineae bacterium]